jgi:hypothetical protein
VSSPDKTPILECLKCERKYSEQDIADLKFFPRTSICYICYRNLQKAPITIACFGKQDKMQAYNPLAVECRLICPDRTICPKFVSGEIPMKHEMTEQDRKRALKLLYKTDKKYRKRNHPFREGTLIYEGFELCRQGTTKKALRKLCAEWQSNADERRLLRFYRKEDMYGCEWKFIEEGNSIRIVFAQKGSVELRQRKK